MQTALKHVGNLSFADEYGLLTFADGQFCAVLYFAIVVLEFPHKKIRIADDALNYFYKR
jgi:hypothetical protein